MAKMNATLITGRSIPKGMGKEYRKLTEKYRYSVTVCEMNEKDMAVLNVKPGNNIKLTTECGSIIVKVVKPIQEVPPGVIYVPYGPWINMIMASATDGTGMPSLKGITVEVESTSEDVEKLEEILGR